MTNLRKRNIVSIRIHAVFGKTLKNFYINCLRFRRREVDIFFLFLAKTQRKTSAAVRVLLVISFSPCCSPCLLAMRTCSYLLPARRWKIQKRRSKALYVLPRWLRGFFGARKNGRERVREMGGLARTIVLPCIAALFTRGKLSRGINLSSFATRFMEIKQEAPLRADRLKRRLISLWNSAKLVAIATEDSGRVQCRKGEE